MPHLREHQVEAFAKASADDSAELDDAVLEHLARCRYCRGRAQLALLELDLVEQLVDRLHVLRRAESERPVHRGEGD